MPLEGEADLKADALLFHSTPRPGKLEIVATKPLANQRDLALAYSPGVAFPCEAIAADPHSAAIYTRARIWSRSLAMAQRCSASARSVRSPPSQ